MSHNTKQLVLATQLNEQHFHLNHETKKIDFNTEMLVASRADRALSLDQYGPKPEVNADNTAAFQAMIDDARRQGLKCVAVGKYTIYGTLDLREVEFDFSATEIILGRTAKLIIGGDATKSWNPDQKLGMVRRGSIKWDPSQYTENPSIICIGAKGQMINIRAVDYLLFYMSTDPALKQRDSSQGYNTFNIQFAVKIEINTDPRYAGGSDQDGLGSANQWFNENKLYINRCLGIVMDGSYQHNNNVFIGGTFENAYCDFDIRVGKNNTFRNLRFEAMANIKFGEQTEGNRLECSWYGSISTVFALKVVDKGVLNRIEKANLDRYNKYRIMEITPFTPRWNNRLLTRYNMQTGRTIRPVTRYASLANTESYMLKGREDLVIFHADGDNTSKYMVRVFVYNADGTAAKVSELSIRSDFLNKVDDATGKFEGTFTAGIDYGSRHFMILTEGEYHIQIQLIGTSAPAESKSKNFVIDLYSATPRRVEATPKMLTQSAPTQYIGFTGDFIQHKQGTTFVDLHEQTVVESVGSTGAGGTVVINKSKFPTVALRANDIIGFESATTGDVHWTKITAETSGTVTVETLADWVTAKDYVYVSRLNTVAAK